MKGEWEKLVEKLGALGREVEYLVFEDEGHGFTKPSNELKGRRGRLRGSSGTCPAPS